MKKLYFSLVLGMFITINSTSVFSSGVVNLQGDVSFKTQVSKLRGVKPATTQMIADFAFSENGQQHAQTYLCKDDETEQYFFEKGPPSTFFVNYRKGKKEDSYVLFKRANLEVSIGSIVPKEWKVGDKKNTALKKEFGETFLDAWCRGLFGNHPYEELPKECQKVARDESSPLISAIQSKGELQLFSVVENANHKLYVWSAKESRIGIRYICEDPVDISILRSPEVLGGYEEDCKTETPSKKADDAKKEVGSPSEQGGVAVTEVIGYYKEVGHTDSTGRRKTKSEILQELKGLSKYCEGLTDEVINSLASLQIVMDKTS